MRLVKSVLFAGLAFFAAACSGATPPAAANYELGKQFQVVREPAKPSDARKIDVEEFFCFCCPHCYAVDPMMAEWRKHKAADVEFKFVPNTLGRPDGEAQARAFYVAQALGVEDKIHLPLFQAIHDQHLQMSTLPELRVLFISIAGVKAEDFDQLSSSFVVDSNVRQAESESRSYGISSTPTVVVGGKYSITGGNPELTKIIDFLVDKVRHERKA